MNVKDKETLENEIIGMNEDLAIVEAILETHDVATSKELGARVQRMEDILNSFKLQS